MAVNHYRGIYILNKGLNTAFGTIVIPFMKMVLIVIFVVSFFAVVRLSKELNAMVLTMLVIVSLTAALLLFPISVIMSSLFDISQQFQRNMRTVSGAIPDQKIRKHCKDQLKSCSLIRCQVGGLYHMEAKAKLTLVQYVVNGIVGLLVNT